MKKESHILSLDLALIRWSVVHKRWSEFSSGSIPALTPFLTGWGWRCMGLAMPDEVGTYSNSFRIGYNEADTEISIIQQQKKYE